MPADAIVGGQDGEGRPLYVCHGGTAEGYGLQPGKYEPELSGCDFGYDGREVTVPDFQYLVSSWKSESGGSIPSNAVIGGCTNEPTRRRVDWGRLRYPLLLLLPGDHSRALGLAARED